MKYTKDKTTVIKLRTNEQTKTQLNQATKKVGTNASAAILAFINRYIRKHLR